MKTTSPKVIIALNFCIFFVFGMFIAGVGPVLSELSRQTNSSLSAIGGVLTFLFLGAFIAQIIAGPLTDRFGQKIILTFSLFILSLGIIGFTNVHTLLLMFLFFFITGLGQGGVDIGANLVVADAYPENNTSVLNLLHFFFGLGAFLGPALIGFAIARIGSGLIVHSVEAGVFFILGVTIIVLLRETSVKKVGKDLEQVEKNIGPKFYLSSLLWLFGSLMLIFVGIEYGLGSWITSYMNITTNTAIQYGALITSLYWGALAIGRLAGAAGSRRLTRIQLLTISLCCSLVGGVGLVISQGSIVPTIICIVWISFSYATIIPTTVAFAISAFQYNQGKAVGFLAAMGSIGGLSIPWFAGFLLVNNPNRAYSLFITLCIGLMLVIVFFINRHAERMENLVIE
jgi:fucose permease